MATLPDRLSDGEIVVRRYRLEDAPNLHAAVQDSLPELRPFMPWAAAEPITLDERTSFLRTTIDAWGDDHTVGIFDASDDTCVLGSSGLHPRIGPGGYEIGYWVRTDAAGRGIATRAARLLTDAAFEHLGADRVEIHHDGANRRSARVPRKLGFELAAVEPDPPVAPADSGIEWRWRTTPDRWRAATTSTPLWPPIELETERLRLRPAKEADRPQLIELSSSAEVRRYLGGPLSAEDAAAALPEQVGQRPGSFAIADLATDELLGVVVLHDERGETEVSYELRPTAWGRGVAAEAVAAVLHRAWGVDRLDEVIAVTQTANERSVRLLRRLGFEQEATFVEFDAEQARFRRSLPIEAHA